MATDPFNNRTAMRLRAIIGAQKTNLSAMGKQLGKTRGYIDTRLRVVPEKLRTLDHGRPWSDDQFASTRLSSNRDMSR